jgi:hypothetical protein
MRGQLFETFVVSEVKKTVAHTGKIDRTFYWRDRAGHEVDIVIEQAGGLNAIECKSGKTIAADSLKPLMWWRELAKNQTQQLSLVYGENDRFSRQGVEVLSWREVPTVIG